MVNEIIAIYALADDLLKRPLAKVANDRHNLAQIARNCRYQQLN
jgi:hypothetical protein